MLSAEGYPTLNLNSRTKIFRVCVCLYTHTCTYVMVLKQTLAPQTTEHLLLLCHIWKSANALWEMWKKCKYFVPKQHSLPLCFSEFSSLAANSKQIMH